MIGFRRLDLKPDRAYSSERFYMTVHDL